MATISVARAAHIGAIITQAAVRSRHGKDIDARHHAAQILSLAGVTVTSNARPSDDVSLVCANHLGYIEIAALIAELDNMVVVAEAKLASWPILGSVMTGLDTIFIDRTRRSAVNAMVDAMVERFGQGRSVLCFPEGTPTSSKTPSQFRTGVFEAAVRSCRPVLPVGVTIETIAGAPATAASREIVSWHRDAAGRRPNFVSHMHRLCAAAPIGLSVRIGTPIEAGTDRKILARQVHAAVTDLCTEDEVPR